MFDEVPKERTTHNFGVHIVNIPQNMGPNENQMEVISYLSPFGKENKLRGRERILGGANNGPFI
jgi:hypothetical protein